LRNTNGTQLNYQIVPFQFKATLPPSGAVGSKTLDWATKQAIASRSKQSNDEGKLLKEKIYGMLCLLFQIER